MFDPLSYEAIGDSLLMALELQRPAPLAEPPLCGAGIYALYYRGRLEAYEALREHHLTAPIYVGKAVVPGSRLGKVKHGTLRGDWVQGRLREHGASIAYAENLEVDQFVCRALEVHPFWVRYAEVHAITEYQPAWNSVLSGFGCHDPGAGRGAGKRPSWDTLHPGRPWAVLLEPSAETRDQLARSLAAHADLVARAVPATRRARPMKSSQRSCPVPWEGTVAEFAEMDMTTGDT